MRTGSAAEVASWPDPSPPGRVDATYAASRSQAVAADAEELRASGWAALCTTMTRCVSCLLTSATPAKVPSDHGQGKRSSHDETKKIRCEPSRAVRE